MIHEVFEVLVNDINRFLKSKHNITEDKVVASSIMNADGSIAVQEPDKIVMVLSGIEIDRTQNKVPPYRKTQRGKFVKEVPPVNANLNVVFAAYFTSENYLEGLKFIASVIAYFQSNTGNFTPQNLPALNGIMDRFTMELLSLDPRDTNNLWGLLGSKYLPSVVYRLKSLPIRHIKPTASTPVITKP